MLLLINGTIAQTTVIQTTHKEFYTHIKPILKKKISIILQFKSSNMLPFWKQNSILEEKRSCLHNHEIVSYTRFGIKF